MTIWRALYGALLIPAYPLVVIRLMWRGFRDPAYRQRRSERFGRLDGSVPRNVVWVHAVSAGEVVAATPLLRALILAFPQLDFLVTTMTPTGAARVRQLFGDAVASCYAPYDFPWTVRRFLNRIEPRLLVLIETELWPNMIRQTAERGAAVVLVNARLSERSARGYRAVAGLTRAMLKQISWIAAQYPDQLQRLVELGAAQNTIEAVGSVKFDVDLPGDFEPQVAALRNRWQTLDRPVWIAASTHAGEEEWVLTAHRLVLMTLPRALLILVPRQPRRCTEVVDLAGRHFSVECTSAAAGPQTEVLVGDTMGELVYLYGVAQVAFIGGSLVAHGAHNPIEAAAAGLPLLVGPHDFNFTEVMARFESAGCLHRVTDPVTLAGILADLFQDAPRREAAADRAREVVKVNGGATSRIVAHLTEDLARSGNEGSATAARH